MVKHLGNKYDTNCGMLEVVKYINSRNVLVRFVNTGFMAVTKMASIRARSVKDPLHPSVFGVGFIGVGEFKVSANRKQTKAYQCWSGMLGRCYSDTEQKRNPTYIGCLVHPDWHNFQTFAKWYHDNHPSDGGKYELDKDILVEGNKIYSPNACMFVSHEENTIKAHARVYTFVSPTGCKVKIYNMAKFCRDNDLNHGCMCQVNSGNQSSHKGWTK